MIHTLKFDVLHLGYWVLSGMYGDSPGKEQPAHAESALLPVLYQSTDLPGQRTIYCSSYLHRQYLAPVLLQDSMGYSAAADKAAQLQSYKDIRQP